jgi:hypothetical protein
LQRRSKRGAAGPAKKEPVIAPISFIFDRIRLLSATWVAIGCVLGLLAGEAGAQSPEDPPVACRNAPCTATLQIGATPVHWRAPETFYPNNEDVFAGAVSSTKKVAEVRRSGPGLCRHTFKGRDGVRLVIKACGPEATLRVNAVRRRPGIRTVTLSYSARPVMDSYTKAQPASPTLYTRLTQITGLAG